MAGQPQVGPEISITELKGINLRVAKSQLGSGENDRMFGLYPRYTGSLNRIPGKQLLRVFEDGDDPREVLQVAQAFMGQSYAVIQNGDAIGLYTADELFNRSTPYSLTPTPPVSTLGSYALLQHQESAGTAGGALGALDNAFYPRRINALCTDADGIIQAVSGNSFTLGIGTYRIKAAAAFGQSATTTAGSQCRAGLFSVTNNAFKTYAGSVLEIISTSGRSGDFINRPFNSWVFLKGRFQVTLPSEVLAIYQANEVAGGTISGETGAQGWAASVGSKTEVYCLIQITKE